MTSKGQYAPYSDTLWTQITEEIESKLSPGKTTVAAFDADGTLWDIDMGESFFQFQQDRDLVKLPENPWDHYKLLKNTIHPTTGYLWLAQICAGLSCEQLEKHCNDHLDTIEPVTVFESQKRLIHWLQSKQVEVYVVTASIKWPVAAAAKRYFGIPETHVIGVEVEVLDGKYTDKQRGDITYREGKPKRLLEATNSIIPVFCSGNTLGDQHLLECSDGPKLAVTSASTDHSMFESENELQDLAGKNGWYSHQFL